MSNSGQLAVGRPDAEVEASYLYFRYCGGVGAGDCLTPIGATSIVLSYRIPRFVVRNRKIIFENRELFGIRIYTDGGSDGLCPNSLDVEQNWYIALSADGILTDAEIIARGQQLSGVLPYQIEFLEDDIPQPKEASWQGRIFVHIYWGSAVYLNEGLNPITEQSLRIIKHEFDQQL